MKPARFLTTMLILIVSASVAFAAGTAANTKITNQATGTYQDASSNNYNATSNTVETSVARVAAVVVNPDDLQDDLSANSFVLFATSVQNIGNYADDIGLVAAVDGTTTGTYSVEIYSDNDGTTGVIDGTDAIVTSTDSIAADAIFNLIIKVTENSGDESFALGEVFDVILTATGHGGVTDTGTFESTVTGADIEVTVDVDNPTPNPGETLTYTVCIDNATGTETAYNVTVNIPIDAALIYVNGSIWYGGTGHGNGTNATDAIDSPTDEGHFASNTVTVFLGDIAAGASACVYYQATVDPNVTPGEDIDVDPDVDHENEDGDDYDDDDPDDDGDGVEIIIDNYYNPVVTVVGADSTSGYPNDQIVFTFTVTNDGNVSDVFDLDFLSDQGWTWVIYEDDGTTPGVFDGSDSQNLTGNTGTMAVDDVLTYHIVINIPGGSADLDKDTNVVTAESQGDGTTDDAEFITLVTAPYLTLVKTVTPSGPQPPGTTLTYEVTISNTGSVAATTVVISDNIPTNTTYVDESMQIDSTGKTDSSGDSDGATCDDITATFDFSSIASGGSHTVSFQVTID